MKWGDGANEGKKCLGFMWNCIQDLDRKYWGSEIQNVKLFENFNFKLSGGLYRRNEKFNRR